MSIVRSGGDEPAEASGRSTPDTCARSRSAALQFVSGAAIGVLGGMIGLGGAEFRLPVLIALFGFAALHAVILNKAMSLVVVLTALPARLPTVPFTEVAAHWSVIANLLGGTLLGAWLGARWATRMRSALLHHILAVLLVLMATVLAWSHFGRLEALALAPVTRTIVGIVAGIGIGLVAALMGVAGGELLIPAIVVLFAIDIKLAGSLSLAVSLPTMLVAFARYSRDQSFVVLRENKRLVLTMAAGSITGTVAGGFLLGITPEAVLIPALVALLLASSIKVWRH